jgi:hypothetical protein
MRKSILLVLLLTVALVANVFGDAGKKKYAIIYPSNSDGINESTMIPVTEKEAKAMLSKSNRLYKTAGILDTLESSPRDAGSTSGPYFGGAPGDSFVVYFNPGAGCKVLEIGFNIGYNANDPTRIPAWAGVNVSLNFTNYDCDAPAGTSGKTLLGEWQAGGVWNPTDWYKAKYAGSPIGAPIWGSFPASNTPDPADAIETVQMAWLGAEADNLGKPFAVVFVPFGDAGAQGGFDDTQNYSALTREQRMWKWYVSDQKWYVWQSIGFWTYALVEFYENTPPILGPGGPYGSVLSADARTLECEASDVDANNAADAGIKEANIVYQVNGGEWKKAAMSLAEGTITDGLWKGDVPAGALNPGDVLTFYFEMTDGAGLTTTTDQFSYGYFVKTADVLFYYNDNSFAPANAKFYYWNESSAWLFDTWVGETDGAAQDALLNMYDYIVRVDGGSPINLDNDVFQAWLATGTAEKKKHLFWSSQEFLGAENGWVNTTYAADDWHNMYLGISAVNHDLQYSATGVNPPAAPWPVNAVLNDPLTGALAKFCADSSFQLLYNPAYEIGAADWSDHVEPGTGAVTCITDSASGVSMGVWKDGATTKTVFLGLDQIALDINPPYGSPGYNWPEFGDPNTGATMGLSILKHSLVWFAAPTAVDDNVAPGVITDYSLSQNYPNPFNPETKISFSIAKAGNVSLAVYNVVGQKVADLVNGQKAAGKYQITWNANDLASGVYFYRLEVGDFSKTMKMMLLR